MQGRRASRVVVASRLNGGNGLLGSKVPRAKKNDGKGFGGATWPRRGVVPGGSTGATAGERGQEGRKKKGRHWKKSKKKSVKKGTVNAEHQNDFSLPDGAIVSFLTIYLPAIEASSRPAGHAFRGYSRAEYTHSLAQGRSLEREYTGRERELREDDLVPGVAGKRSVLSPPGQPPAPPGRGGQPQRGIPQRGIHGSRGWLGGPMRHSTGQRATLGQPAQITGSASVQPCRFASASHGLRIGPPPEACLSCRFDDYHMHYF